MIGGDTARLISQDVADDVRPEDSKRVKYGREETEFYDRVKADFDEYRKKHPGAVLDVRE